MQGFVDEWVFFFSLRFMQKFKMAAENGEKTIFIPAHKCWSYSHPLRRPGGGGGGGGHKACGCSTA